MRPLAPARPRSPTHAHLPASPPFAGPDACTQCGSFQNLYAGSCLKAGLACPAGWYADAPTPPRHNPHPADADADADSFQTAHNLHRQPPVFL